MGGWPRGCPLGRLPISAPRPAPCPPQPTHRHPAHARSNTDAPRPSGRSREEIPPPPAARAHGGLPPTAIALELQLLTPLSFPPPLPIVTLDTLKRRGKPVAGECGSLARHLARPRDDRQWSVAGTSPSHWRCSPTARINERSDSKATTMDDGAVSLLSQALPTAHPSLNYVLVHVHTEWGIRA